MNRIIFYIVFLFVMFSCQNNQMEYISSIEVQVNMPNTIKPEYTFAQKEVVLRSDRMTYTSTTNAQGVATFENVIPDIYSVFCSWDIDGETYATMSTELVENRPALIAAIRSKINLFAPSTIELNALLSVKQNLLLSKVYAAGTRYDNNSRYDADNFIEIFNNSDEVQYIDGIYLALVEGDSPAGFPSKDNPEYVHARQIFRFPGNGTDYPVPAGKSIVVANSAYNHSATLPRSVNLENADFEFKGTTYNNNDFVEGMQLVYTAYVAIKHLNLHRGGVNSLCLFSTDEDVSAYPITYLPGKTTGNMFIRIPARSIFDGVEILVYRVTGVDISTKRIQDFIDASYTSISSTGGLNNQSMERKVDAKRSDDKRDYLIDTNNSQKDFVVIDKPTPRDYSNELLRK